ncbi:MAG: hypothetical protein WDO12_14150 [Pseudomonadota bacterium]
MTSARITATHRDYTPWILAALALASRVQFFGNPLLESDEGFYLLVGDHMLHGALPYVDIWDRKPVGLFLLYAAMRALGGDGVLSYQLVGTGFVLATSLLITRIAREFSTAFGALAAGAAYLIWMTWGSAMGGQAEIFYAPLVCAAALLTMRGMQATPACVSRQGALAMLLIGVAAQVKYNALFEGMFFGCCWLFIGWRSGRRAMLVPHAALWIFAAVLPTLLATAWYAAHGDLDAFLFANFLSVWQRTPATNMVLLQRLGIMVLILVPLLACVRPFARIPDDAGATAHRFTMCWLAAAILSVLGFGTYLEQYLLPILVPASAAAAPLLGSTTRQRATIFLAIALLLGQARLAFTQWLHGSRAELAQIVRHIDRSGCLYIYSGFSSIYRVSNACIPTRFAFPSHLSRVREAGATGVDPVQEVDRILNTHPPTVLVRGPYSGDENWDARAELLHHLRLDYQLAFQGRLGTQKVEVYRLSGRLASRQPDVSMHDMGATRPQ